MPRLITFYACWLAAFICSCPTTWAEAIPVELKKTEQGWQLLRGGEPYFIKGAGGDASLEVLAAAGGNSIRTWGVEHAQSKLDQAHKLGLTVTVGIWLGHERHGFDYSDPVQVSEQLELARQAVLRFKDHPALLLWGVGNEMEGFEAGDNPDIWRAVNDIAAMIKTLDPHHPTMVVTAEAGGARIEQVHKLSPAVDIHGINSYGGATSINKRLRAAGASKPYVLTEFGAVGAWEMPKTQWGAPYEQTSTQKAAFFAKSYEHAVLQAPGESLGSYVFAWGHKMEGTATWLGMFLDDDTKLAAVDTMTKFWSGTEPENLAPRVEPLKLSGSPEVKPGAIIKVASSVTDPEGETLRAHWALRDESNEYSTGGDFRRNLPDIETAIIAGNVDGARVRVPKEPGAYRLFFYAWDQSGGAATANIPILVKGKVRPRMPVAVYEEGFDGMPWAPSGWMGGVDYLTIDGENTDNPHQGEHSVKIEYTGKFNWVGVAWQNPSNNWGEQPGGFDLTGAKSLEVWARGEYGGEKVSFGVGIIGQDKEYPDSGLAKVDDIVLTDQWTRYVVPLRKVDLSSIKTGFVVTLNGRVSPVTIYLDDIRFIR